MSTQISGVTITIDDDVLPGRAIMSAAELSRSQMAQNAFDETPIPFTAVRVWDDMASLLPSTAATDDLGLYTGTPGTNATTLKADDVKATSSSRKAAFEVEVPPNWDDDTSFEIRVRAGMETTVADTSCTIDVEAFLPDGAGAVGADLVSTAAQDFNSLTPNDYDFAISPATFNPGDKLICVITVAYVDSATATAVTPAIYNISRRCDTRG